MDPLDRTRQRLAFDDDRPAGRVLRRRAALALIAAAGWMSSASVRAAGACVARPQQTEGPFFVDERLLRSDVRSDPATGRVAQGAPLALTLAVARFGAGACAPLRDARVDIWQCDAEGRYSDVRDGAGSTAGQQFLRGTQLTDAQGLAHFTTIVPGWYAGRAVHIHFRIDAPDGAPGVRRFTSQLYFDDAFVDRVHARAPYAARGARPVRNASDGLFRDGGAQLLLDVRDAAPGFAARFDVALA